MHSFENRFVLHYPLSDLSIDLIDLAIQKIDVSEHLLHMDTVMRYPKRALKSVLELRDLGPHSAQRQVREDNRVGLAGEHLVQHRSPRLCENRRRGKREFDADVLERLLQSLDTSSSFLDQAPTIPGEIPKLTDRRPRDK
ncbi:hypothetical protein [Cryobacterium sp. Sr3]|uniref:hypothetical protein n=1 Tax=Cryobacterium sp. Sr3 TaxID=1259194 RepID=UPI00106BC7B4|nr:hypothetical protein [Cryobacterium sp. Sr3]TFB61007.1 hypothetical protein E3N94_00635 [Cryobacterium sp. Sr3]